MNRASFIALVVVTAVEIVEERTLVLDIDACNADENRAEVDERADAAVVSVTTDAPNDGDDCADAVTVQLSEPLGGRDVLLAEREAGVSRRLRGIVTEGRRPPRTGCAVLIGDDEVGEVTSGNFSPVLGHGIAMAFLPPEVELDQAVDIDVRGTRLPGRVVKMPFVS